MTPTENLWVNRFVAWERDGMADRCRRLPDTIDLTGCDVELGSVLLTDALTELFVPTEQVLAIIEQLYRRARAHSVTLYGDRQSYLRHCYGEHPMPPKYIAPIYLTGLAGTGKSELISALQRVMPRDQVIALDDYHPSIPMHSLWRVRMPSSATSRHVYQLLLSGHDRKLPRRADDLADLCRHQAYVLGISLLVIDEFQFVTSSPTAHAQLSSVLLDMSLLGIPMVYVGNYSLGTRLKKRPQEDQERLLADPVFLGPDAATSSDWVRTVAACRAVAPDVLVYDPVRDAAELHRFTAGLKRLLRILIVTAYRRARAVGADVDLPQLRATFQSQQYATARQTVQELYRLTTTGASKRQDLKCPIEQPLEQEAIDRRQRADACGAAVQKAAVEASLTPGQRKTLEELRRAGTETPARAKGKRNASVTSLEALRAGEDMLKR
jgi:hypothetical protein